MRFAGVLAQQHFAGSALVRGGFVGGRLEALLARPEQHPHQEFALVADRRIAVTGGGDAGAAGLPSVRWLDRAGLAAIHLTHAGGEALQFGGGGGGAPGTAPGPLPMPVYFLGEDRQRQTLRLAVDVTGAPPGWAEAQQFRMQDLRSLMPLLTPEELSVAGHAMALSQWHQAHLFCGRCGAPSTPADGGSRRQCTAHEDHRSYPRTDPVAIMACESPCGGYVLLGRSKKMRAGMLTCLSGFVDQGEGIEEAVARETREEAGVELVAVDIVGSQPWPVGRGGSCELMIGCIAKAAGEPGAGLPALTVDEEEMEEVRWVSRADVAEAVRLSEAPDSPYLGGSGGEAGQRLGFFVPPPFAIAHHLLKRWAQHGGPWFAGGQRSAAAAPAAASHL